MPKRLFRFFSRSRNDIVTDVRDEFSFHIDMRVEDLVRAGMPEADARRQALDEFGDVERGLRACAAEGATIERQHLVSRLISELCQDAWYGLRLLRQSPGFSAVAVLTLALAIGGNTTIFSVVNALAFRPLPARAPHELVRVYSGQSQTSWLNYADILERNTVFSDVVAHSHATLSLSVGDTAVRLVGESTSTNYLTTLGIPPLLGRTYMASDTRTDVIVLGERAWRTRFAADPGIVGRTLTLGNRTFEVVGVMPHTFRGARPPGFVSEFWVAIDPVLSSRVIADRRKPAYEVVGRLKPGIGIEQAHAAMLVLANDLKTEYPGLDDSFVRTEIFPIDGIGGFRGLAGTLAPVFAFVGLMTIVTGFVLLVGCANIAGLLLGRGAARRREIGVRLALGASRGRLIRQLLTESLILALLGGVAGVLLALWLGGLLNALVGRLPVPIEFDLTLDRRLLSYALLVSIATSLLFGLAPARKSTRFDIVPALKDDARTPSRQRARQWLVVGQIAISCLLLMWGGLFLRSLGKAHEVDPGFNPSGVLVASIELDEGSLAAPAIAAEVGELLSRIRELPGVQSAGASTIVPLSLTGREEYRARTDADPPDARGRWVMANRVSPDWLPTLGIPLLAGRDLTAQDRGGGPRVVIVNETLARVAWNGSAVGKRVNDAEVVGVVRDSKYWTLGETVMPTVYTPFAQNPVGLVNLLVRTSNMNATARALRVEIARRQPGVAADIAPMTEAIGAALLPAQVGAAFTGAFGALAMLLTMMGIYGLVSFTVAQRRREIGIRMAVGASTRDIVGGVIRGLTVPVAAGLIGGIAVGSLGAHALGGFIVGVSPIDPLTIAATALLVAATAAAASAVPALSAARVDPLDALRAE
jgi:predicted permease